MQIKHVCVECDGTGIVGKHDPYSPETEQPCPYCQGVGYLTTDIIGTDFTDILDKIQEVKTKINTMQADVNYIKSKVG